MPAEEYDVIIVGAGQSGIASARFYLEVHPDVRLIVIEKGSVVGGTWGRGLSACSCDVNTSPDCNMQNVCSQVSCPKQVPALLASRMSLSVLD